MAVWKVTGLMVLVMNKILPIFLAIFFKLKSFECYVYAHSDSSKVLRLYFGNNGKRSTKWRENNNNTKTNIVSLNRHTFGIVTYYRKIVARKIIGTSAFIVF